MQERALRQVAPVALPDGPDGITWRRIDAGDLDALHTLALRAAEVDDPGHRPGRADLEQQLGAIDPETMTALAVGEGGPVAYGIVFVTPFAAAVRLPGAVLPEVRGTGIGRRLLAWQVAQARAARPSEDTPISARQPSTASATASLLARAGFRPERTFLALRRPPSPVTGPALPPGLHSVPLTPDMDEPLRLAKNRAFEDHWRSRPETRDAWAQHQLGPWLRRDLSRLAVTPDGRVAGFVVAWAEDDAADEVYISLVGTVPDHRERGIARALLAEVLSASADVGRPVATLDVDGENPTSAARLYAAIGFETVSAALIHGLVA